MMRPHSVPVVLLILTLSLAAAAQKRVYTVASEEVRIDVLVADGDRPVPDLSPSDFKVFDDGVLQTIDYARLQRHMPIHAILVFDMSRSVSGTLLSHLKEAAQQLFSDFEEGDRAALITFNHTVALGSPLTSDLASIQSALQRTRPFGNSSLIDATYTGLAMAESGVDVPLIILFSDGYDTSSWLTGDMVLETAKRSPSVVYAVSTQRRPNESFLNDITDFTGGSLHEAEFIVDLPSVFVGILEEFRKRYVLAYTPRGVPETGWHRLEVQVRHPTARIRTRPGYVRSAPER